LEIELSFRRWRSEDLQNQLRDLYNMLFRYNKTNDEPDGAVEMGKSGMFSVKSVYTHLHRNSVAKDNRQFWKAKIPLKIKIFMWLVMQNAILTKDNLLKRKWVGGPSCAFSSR
jgi:hypothetical protein